MHKTHLYLLIALGFLTSGMISCSQDENVVYQADSFRPDSVSAQNQDRSFFKNGNITSLDAGGNLIFDELQQHNFKSSPILFKIESACRHGLSSELSYHRTDFQNQKQIPVLRLLPENLLGQLQTQNVECDFTITSTRGDTFSYNINNSLKAVQIKNLESYSNFPENFNEERLSVEDVSTRQFTLNQEGVLRLNCQDFSTSVSSANAPLSLGRLSLLDSSIIENLKQSEQMCRWVFKGETSTHVSGMFFVQFPVAPLEIKAKVLKLPLENPINTPAVLDVQITNPNPFAVEMRISQKNASRFLYRPIYVSRLSSLLGKTHKIPIAWQSSDVDLSLALDNKETLLAEIPGQSTIVISGIANKTIKCQAPKIGMLMNESKSPKYIGQNYDYILNSQFEFKQAHDQWTSVELVPQGKPKKTAHSDLEFWSWPNNDTIKQAIGNGPLFDVWSNMNQTSDLCRE